MKVFLLITMSLLTITSFAEASSLCAFGETTGDLRAKIESKSARKIWYAGEHLSLHNPQRLQGLSAFEKEMILMSVQNDGQVQGVREALLGFAGSDGYISYFSHNSNNRQFAIVASYPGDNEFGLVLEISGANSRNKTPQIVDVAAVIVDGDLEDCKVTK